MNRIDELIAEAEKTVGGLVDLKLFLQRCSEFYEKENDFPVKAKWIKIADGITSEGISYLFKKEENDFLQKALKEIKNFLRIGRKATKAIIYKEIKNDALALYGAWKIFPEKEKIFLVARIEPKQKTIALFFLIGDPNCFFDEKTIKEVPSMEIGEFFETFELLLKNEDL